MILITFSFYHNITDQVIDTTILASQTTQKKEMKLSHITL